MTRQSERLVQYHSAAPVLFSLPSNTDAAMPAIQFTATRHVRNDQHWGLRWRLTLLND
jgi:hypothetical protein